VLAAIAPHQTFMQHVLLQLVVFVVAVAPGYPFAAMLMDRLGCKAIQVIGFTMMAVSFAAMAAVPGIEKLAEPLLIIDGVSYFLAEFGPMPRRSFNNSERVLRDTPSAFAASVTVSPSGSRHSCPINGCSPRRAPAAPPTSASVRASLPAAARCRTDARRDQRRMTIRGCDPLLHVIGRCPGPARRLRPGNLPLDQKYHYLRAHGESVGKNNHQVGSYLAESHPQHARIHGGGNRFVSQLGMVG
jgi:hypothetical protein